MATFTVTGGSKITELDEVVTLDGSDKIVIASGGTNKFITASQLAKELDETTAHYAHDQVIASASWAVVHNLGKFPSLSIVDTGGNEVEGEVQHIDNNNLIITFSSSFAGKAYLN